LRLALGRNPARRRFSSSYSALHFGSVKDGGYELEDLAYGFIEFKGEQRQIHAGQILMLF
jgi:hypothetical protein